MRWVIVFLIVVIIFLSGFWVWITFRPLSLSATPNLEVNQRQLVQAKVTKVFDGDTIEVQFMDGHRAKVRYLGVDTPETVDPNRPIGCFGFPASNLNKQLVDKKTVYLEKDISDMDKYDRLLRYVYLRQNQSWILVNDYLIRNGMGTVLSLPPDDRLTPRLLLAEQEARSQRRGLWKKC